MHHHKLRNRALLAVMLPLIAIVLCGGLAWLLLGTKPMDAVAELKLMDVYPAATAVSLSGNSQYQKGKGSASWTYKGGRSWIGSDDHRNLDVTVATIIFETSDKPDSVQAFYGAQATKRKYYEIEGNPPDKQYLRYEDPYGILDLVEDYPGLYRDRPITFFQLSISAAEISPQNSTAGAVTSVAIEAMILRELGGLR